MFDYFRCLFLSSSYGTLPFVLACMLRVNSLYLDVLLELAEIINLRLIEVMPCIYNSVLPSIHKACRPNKLKPLVQNFL